VKFKLMMISALVGLFCASCVSSGPQIARDSTQTEPKDLVQRMVQVAADRYRAGRLESARQILEASLEIEPGNAAARYYMSLVRESRYQEPLQVWYPAIPPRPADK
jgi:Tfp pilus assembly protein PilF